MDEIIRIVHRHEIPVLADGARAAPHFDVNVETLDCDFYCFSGHKLFGPSGIGVLYGKEAWLESMPPCSACKPATPLATLASSYNDPHHE